MNKISNAQFNKATERSSEVAQTKQQPKKIENLRKIRNGKSEIFIHCLGSSFAKDFIVLKQKTKK